MSTYPGSFEDRPHLQEKTSDRPIGRDSLSSWVRGRKSGKISENPVITADLDEQSQAIEDGLLTMPLDVARESVLRWADFLRTFDEDVRLERVAATLTQLSSALSAPKLEARPIGTLLHRLGMETRAVAITRTGIMGMCLDRLADALIFSGLALTRQMQ